MIEQKSDKNWQIKRLKKNFFLLDDDEEGMYEDADEPGEDGGEHENGSTPMEESWNIFIESTTLHY